MPFELVATDMIAAALCLAGLALSLTGAIDGVRADTFRALQMFGSIIAWLAIAATGLGMLQGFDLIADTNWSTTAP